jgi:uncharacterized RDD family membrane protein YckC
MTGFDSSLVMQTPEGIEYTLFPAGILVRACAWGTDFLIKGLVLFVLVIITSIMGQVLGIWFFFIINFVLNWFYYTVFELLWNGQSPGKRVMGIRVVGSDGSPVSPGASFLRNLLRFADGFYFLYLIAFICMAVSPGFRRFGDWAGDTLVIYTADSRILGRFSPALQRQQSIPWLANVAAQAPEKKLSYEEKQALLMFARRYPLLGKERADEIAQLWAAVLRHPDGPGKNSISDSEYLLGIAHTINRQTL